MTLWRALGLAAAVLVAAAAAWGLRHGRVPGGTGDDPTVLSSFEELVLMRLDGLRGNPLASGFLSGLKEKPDLRRYLAGTEDPRVLAGFRTLVRKYEEDPGFREAVNNAEFAGSAQPPKAPGVPKPPAAAEPTPPAAPAPAPPPPAEPAPCGPPAPGKQPEPSPLDAAGPKCGTETAPTPLALPAN